MAQVMIRDLDEGALESVQGTASANGRSREADPLAIEREARWRSDAEDFWRESDAFRASLAPQAQNDSAILRHIGRRGEEDPPSDHAT